jgi:hypothetical protein
VTSDDPGGLWRGRKQIAVKGRERDAADVAMQAGQLTVFVETVRTLVGEQFRWWRGLPVRRLRP